MSRRGPTPIGVTREFSRAYWQSAKNFEILASRLGMNPDVVSELAKRVDAGEILSSDPENLKYLHDKLESIAPPSSGGDLFDVVKTKTGPGYTITDYRYDPNRSAPYRQRYRRFQVIVKGKEGGNERYVTTHANQSFEGAMTELRKIISEYKKFQGEEVLIREFDDTGDEEEEDAGDFEEE